MSCRGSKKKLQAPIAAPVPSQPLVLLDAKERYQGGSPSGKSSAEAHQQHFPSTCRQPPVVATLGRPGHTRIRARSVLPRPHASLLAKPLTRARSIRPRPDAALLASPLTRARSIRPRPDAALLASPLTRAGSVPPRPHALLPAGPLARARSVLPRPHASLPASPLLHGVHPRPRNRQRQRLTNSRGCNRSKRTCGRTGTASSSRLP